MLFYYCSTCITCFKIKIQQAVVFMPFVLLPKAVSNSSAYFEQAHNKEKQLGIHTERSWKDARKSNFFFKWLTVKCIACLFCQQSKELRGEKRMRNMPYPCPTWFLLLDQNIISILKGCKNISKELVPYVSGVEQEIQYQGKVQDSCSAELNAT